MDTITCDLELHHITDDVANVARMSGTLKTFIVESFRGTDESLHLAATTTLRKLLCNANNEQLSMEITAVMDSGILPRLVEFLKADADADDDDNAPLQFQACWALTNLLCGGGGGGGGGGTGTNRRHECPIDAICACGGVGEFIRLIDSPSQDVSNQSVWALGNLAGDSSRIRDIVLSANALPPLLALFDDRIAGNVASVRNATWVLCMLCGGKPRPDFARVRDAIPRLVALITDAHADTEVLTDACWAMSYVANASWWTALGREFEPHI
jgi:importin subunit alpha-1